MLYYILSSLRWYHTKCPNKLMAVEAQLMPFWRCPTTSLVRRSNGCLLDHRLRHSAKDGRWPLAFAGGRATQTRLDDPYTSLSRKMLNRGGDRARSGNCVCIAIRISAFALPSGHQPWHTFFFNYKLASSIYPDISTLAALSWRCIPRQSCPSVSPGQGPRGADTGRPA